MSAIWIVLIVFGAALLALLLLIAAALFIPIVLTIDSGKGQTSLRWLAVVEYRRPLPWAEGEAGLSIAGKPVKLAKRETKPKRRRKAAARRRRTDRARILRFLRRCLGTPAIRRELASKLKRLGKGILRSATLTRRRINLSLSDPAWNGMLAGWMAWRGAEASPIRVDFSGENRLFLQIRLYPYRLAKTLLLFSIGLPYRALWREWRAASATVSG